MYIYEFHSRWHVHGSCKSDHSIHDLIIPERRNEVIQRCFLWLCILSYRVIRDGDRLLSIIKRCSIQENKQSYHYPSLMACHLDSLRNSLKLHYLLLWYTFFATNFIFYKLETHKCQDVLEINDKTEALKRLTNIITTQLMQTQKMDQE